MRRSWSWVVLWLGAAGAAAGDRDVAEFLLKKAEKAFRARKYEEAAEDYRRARQEFAPLPEAALGLGEALEKLDRSAEAIAAYRACVTDVGTEAAPSPKWKGLAKRAEAAMARLQRRFAELDRLNQEFIRRSVKFGREQAEKSPLRAREALEAVLRLDPSHAEAKALLAELAGGAPPSPPEGKPAPAKAWGRSLIGDDDLGPWDPGLREPWSCAKGVIAADVKDRQGQINWQDEVRLEGRYELRVRVRVARDGGAGRTFGLFIGDGRRLWHSFLVQDDDALVFLKYDLGEDQRLADTVLRGFKLGEWHTLRLEVDGHEVTVHMDDAKVFSHADPDEDPIAGKPALFAQNGRFEFRDLEVRP
jgi:tetratricopeptide (TPR) repeat protein